MNNVSDIAQGVFGVAEYLPYILILLSVSIVFIIVAVWTGAFSSIANLVGNAFWYIVGVMVFVVGAVLVYDNLSKHKRAEREKAIIYSLVILVVIMILLFNLPSIVYASSSLLSSLIGRVSSLSMVSFPVTVQNPGLAVSYFEKTSITNIGQPTVYPNAITFSIPTLSIFTSSVYIHVTAVCNDTLSPTSTPSVSEMTPPGYKIISTSSTQLIVSNVAGGSQTVYVNVTNIPDSGMCFYFFSLSGPNVNPSVIPYFYNIQTGIGS